MAPSLVQQKAADLGATVGASATCTFSSALTNGTLLIALGTVSANSTVTFSDNASNTWTTVNTHYWSNVGEVLAIGWAANTSTSAATVTATFGTSGPYRSMVIAEFSGMATSSPVDVSTTGKNNAATTAPTDNAMTTTVSGDLIISTISSDGNTFSAGSGYTLVASNLASAQTGMEYSVQATAGAVTPAWTQSTSVQALCLSAAFTASGGGPALPPELIMQTRRPY